MSALRHIRNPVKVSPVKLGSVRWSAPRDLCNSNSFVLKLPGVKSHCLVQTLANFLEVILVFLRDDK